MDAFDGLGKALRWIRDKQAKKQYQVADDAGVTKAMLSAYETGKQKPSIETLEKIMRALHVDLAELSSVLRVVNERHPEARLPGAYPPTAHPERLSSGEPPVDVYAVLGLQRPLPPLAEEALAEMLRGFHKLLRHYHQTLVAATAGGEPPPPAGGSPKPTPDNAGPGAGKTTG